MLAQAAGLRQSVQIPIMSLCGALFVLLLCLVFSPYYVEGDQITYRYIFDAIDGMSFYEALVLYSGTFGFTSELGHFVVIWLGSNAGISKDFLMALLNSTLAYCSMLVLRNMKVNPLVAIALVGSNYYFYGLYFAAERLKFGFLFFFLALLAKESIYRRVAAILLSVFSHVQMVIVYGCIAFAQKSGVAIRYLLRLRVNVRSIVGLVVFGVVFALLGDYIFLKIGKYSEYGSGQSISAFGRLTAFLAMSLWYSKDRRNTVMMFLLLYPAVFVVGPERVNMLGYVFFLYDGLRYRGGVNFGVLLTSIYFGLKGISFVVEFVETGQGFGEFTTFPGNVLF